MSEREWQKQVTVLFRELGWNVWHFDDRQANAGFPDLTCLHPDGRLMFIELKNETRKPTDKQQEVIDTLRKGGHSANIFRPSDWDKIVELVSDVRFGVKGV